MRSAKLKLELTSALASPRPQWSNPVVPGDHPDPTILRIGNAYWASCTSGEWSPQFPLFRSDDLVDWKPAGSIFPKQPEWANGSFWAPEMIHDEATDRCVLWYVGRNRQGSLAIAVATAPAPNGPWTDYGPVVCDPDGSIDPCFARDELGAPFLIWKEDGNSQGRPTPIWAQPLSDDLLRLTGEKTMLITNDQPWEDGVVEGPYILRRGGYFYLFYAGNTCCGRKCNYAEGVARSAKLLGPWEKFPGNPFISSNNNWRCPGHGTVVQEAENGTGEGTRDYLLYHAYPAGGSVFVGREAVLDEILWPAAHDDGGFGWPQVNSGSGPGETPPPAAIDFADDFSSPHLDRSWQWPVNTVPEVSFAEGRLTLGIPGVTTLSDRPVEAAMLALPRPASLKFHASVGLVVPALPQPGLWAGLSVVGDPFNTVGLGLRGAPADWPDALSGIPDENGRVGMNGGHLLTLWERRGAHQRTLWQMEIPAGVTDLLQLRSTSIGDDHCLQFSYSIDGHSWQNAGEAYDPSELPAWDHGLRIALMLEGALGQSATFGPFELRAQ